MRASLRRSFSCVNISCTQAERYCTLHWARAECKGQDRLWWCCAPTVWGGSFIYTVVGIVCSPKAISVPESDPLLPNTSPFQSGNQRAEMLWVYTDTVECGLGCFWRMCCLDLLWEMRLTISFFVQSCDNHWTCVLCRCTSSLQGAECFCDLSPLCQRPSWRSMGSLAEEFDISPKTVCMF